MQHTTSNVLHSPGLILFEACLYKLKLQQIITGDLHHGGNVKTAIPGAFCRNGYEKCTSRSSKGPFLAASKAASPAFGP